MSIFLAYLAGIIVGIICPGSVNKFTDKHRFVFYLLGLFLFLSAILGETK